MEVHKLETTITQDGKIYLPTKLRSIFSHRVEITLKDKENKAPGKKLEIPTFLCGGKLKDFSREEIYDDRF